MKPPTKILIALNLFLLFSFLAYGAYKNEELLDEGDLVLLALAPVDPRSLMQGDYMRLDYEIARGKSREVTGKRGFVVVRRDGNGVGRLVRYQPDAEPVADGEYLIRYQDKDWSLDIGAGSYFFEEGQASRFEAARYGGLKVDKKGNSLLVGLYNEDLQLIKADTTQ